jgi:hypothetical protein
MSDNTGDMLVGELSVLLVVSSIVGHLNSKGRSMDIQSILADLKRERDRLNSAIAALEGPEPRRRGRPAGSGASSSASSSAAPASASKRPRRHMSPAARKRISDMMKQRWAERKRKGKA